MRKNQTQKIADIISALIKKNGIEDRLAEVRIKHAWEKLLGKTVTRYTKSIFLKNNILYITLTSSIVKNEIMLMRDDLIRKINEYEGNEIVKKIVLK